VPQRKSLLESNSESGYKVEVVGGVVVRTPLEVRTLLSVYIHCDFRVFILYDFFVLYLLHRLITVVDW